MYVIKKVLNSSVVLVTDRSGNEFVLLGKGLGYGRKPGEEVGPVGADQVFVPVEKAWLGQIQELASEISPQLIEVTQEIVAEAERLLGVKLSKKIYLVLADHLNFAIERMREGMRITNRVFWEIKNYYPDEFRAGLVGLSLVQSRLGIELPEEEAANLAFHFANARSDGEDYDSMRYAKVMGQIVNLTLLSLNRNVDTKSIHYLRFVTHVKYFVERCFTGHQLNDQDGALYDQLAREHTREAEIAHKIARFMKEQHGIEVTQDEVVYLLVHLSRLNAA